MSISLEEMNRAENMMDLEQKQMSAQREQEAKEYWGVEVLEQVKDINPSQFHPDKKWMVTHFNIERPDGNKEEVESTKIILKIKNKNGEEIEVPAFATHHIMSLHLKGEKAGSVMATDSLESSFKIVAEHLPRELPFKDGTAAFEVDVEQNTGMEGVSSQKEMLEKGVATKRDLEILETAKEDVFRLNIVSTEDEKKKFLDEFNAKFSGNVKLGIRGGAITPFFTAEKQPTSKMFLVVGKEKQKDDLEHNCVWTMTPGRYMDKLPNDGKFSGKYPIEGIPEGTTVADLWKKVHEGGQLSSEEIKLIDQQKKAQECWWNAGFIVPPEAKVENKEKRFVMYTAEFVKDIPNLLKEFPPKHSKVFGHHSTIAFKPGNLDEIEIGKETVIKIIGRAYDEKGDALLVENPKSKNRFSHITLSCAEGVSPVYSNELFEKAAKSNTIEYFANPIEIEVVEGYSDGKVDVIKKE